MGWREELGTVTLPDGRILIGASFRGVPYFVESVDRAGGRRAVNYEFPLRDDNFVDDLGRHTRVFRDEGYVIGGDYLDQKKALLAALEDEIGPGQLLHPYHGSRKAVCTGCSVRESIAEGGMARFAIEYTEAPAQSVPPPIDAADAAAAVTASSDAASQATSAQLEGDYDVAGLPPFALASAAAAIVDVSEALRSALAPAIDDVQELAALNDQLNALTASASALAREPAQIVDEVTSTITSLVASIASSPEAIMNALISAYGAPSPPLATPTTGTREKELANQLALGAALRQVLAIEAARIAATVTFATLDDATAARDAITTELDTEAALAGDTAYPAIVQLRADLVTAVPGDADLAKLVTITRMVAVPSVLLSYQLYGSVDEELALVARNDARNPVFLSGALSVLSSG